MPDIHGQQYILDDETIAERLSARPPYIPPPIPLNSVQTVELTMEPGVQPISLMMAPPNIVPEKHNQLIKEPKSFMGYNTANPSKSGAVAVLLA